MSLSFCSVGVVSIYVLLGRLPMITGDGDSSGMTTGDSETSSSDTESSKELSVVVFYALSVSNLWVMPDTSSTAAYIEKKKKDA